MPRVMERAARMPQPPKKAPQPLLKMSKQLLTWTAHHILSHHLQISPWQFNITETWFTTSYKQTSPLKIKKEASLMLLSRHEMPLSERPWKESPPSSVYLLALKKSTVSDGSEQDLNENIRAFIRKGVQSGHITEQDIESFVTEQIVPFEGPTSYAAFSQIQTYLAQCGVPFVHHRTSVSSGSAPGCSVRSYMAQKVPSEIIEDSQTGSMVDNPVHKSDKSVEEEVEVAESDQPEHSNPEDTSSINANCSGYQAQKKVDDRSPVSDVASKEKVDEGDGHGSQTTEAHQLDDLDAQDTEPAVVGEDESCGKEPRSDTIGESDYDAYERKTLESCEAAVEQSTFHKQRAQEQLEHATSKISQCDEMAQHAAALRRLVKQRREMENQMDYHEREIEDLKVSIQEV
ncbi:hypothetical protein IWW34DRAFT_815569 [Fusarium oxysporum f. sp. albedinis]|nr:hypothetical protein IWW34DRAFT_815569 [Fusarium oxysporum f. sp. albedinis]